MPPLALMYFAAPWTALGGTLEDARDERVVVVGDDPDADRVGGDPDVTGGGLVVGLGGRRGDPCEHQAGGHDDGERRRSAALPHDFPLAA